MSNTEVQEVQQEIIKCSCCKMKYFKCDFEGKRLGQIYKTCVKCRKTAEEKRKPVDYSKCVIYKIVCKDENIKENYVGSSVNFKDRILKHKSRCNNQKSREYNFKVYQFIRENGGWDNWDMIKIIDVDCEDEKELKYYEQLYISSLNPKLNCKKSYTTEEDRKEYQKESNKEYKEKNKDKIKEHNKEYYQQNKDKEKQRAKENREKNKEKASEKINCECGGIYTRHHKASHFKTKKHLNKSS